MNTDYGRFFDLKFFVHELKDIISCCNPKSSAGPDLINNFILKLLPESALTILIKAFNNINTDGSYPSS